MRFSNIPRDAAYVEKNRDALKNNTKVKLITPTIKQFYESVTQGTYPDGTVFVCHDTLYYMTQLQLNILLNHGHVVFSYIDYPTYNGCYEYMFNEGYFIVNCN